MRTIRFATVKQVMPAIAGLFLLSIFGSSANAEGFTFSIDFSVLPSTQGWTYDGDGAAASEATTILLSGGVMSYDTMDTGQNTARYLKNGLAWDRYVEIHVRMRVTQYEQLSNPYDSGFNPRGASFSINGLYGKAMAWGITPTSIGNMDPNGYYLTTPMASGLDNASDFHDYYVIGDFAPGGDWEFYRDGVLLGTGSWMDSSDNQITFGDSSHYANADAYWDSYSITSSSTQVPEPNSLILLGAGLGAVALTSLRWKK